VISDDKELLRKLERKEAAFAVNWSSAPDGPGTMGDEDA
jgi:hypothetical protein